jgi:hypothetical protein
MKAVAARFYECRPMRWAGRYARIPGDGRVFHLKPVGGDLWPVILWDTDDGRRTCKAVRCDAAAQLAESVARAKRRAGGSGGGAFIINEFGRIIVPASDGRGERYLAGDLDGRLLFENPFYPDEPIDLGDVGHLQPGDPWKLPYIGVPYNLHRGGHVYFYRDDESGGTTVLPPRQDPQLVQALRTVRPRGPVRFIVNPAGIVLAKCPLTDSKCSEEFWQPVFVGSVSHNLWFAKE